jgi:hypothetical protein
LTKNYHFRGSGSTIESIGIRKGVGTKIQKDRDEMSDKDANEDTIKNASRDRDKNMDEMQVEIGINTRIKMQVMNGNMDTKKDASKDRSEIGLRRK